MSPSTLAWRTIARRTWIDLVWIVLALVLASIVPTAAVAQTVDVAITADNAYSLGYGNVSGVSPGGLLGNVENCFSSEIFSCATGPETYMNVPGGPGQFLYIVAYADNATTQGILGQFVDTSTTNTVYTGTAAWQVYATGMDIDPNCPSGPPNGPLLSTINTEIAKANTNTGGPGSSVGWVGPTSGPGLGVLAIGEANDNLGGTFGQVCPSVIGTSARWMWYNPDPSIYTNPFGPPVPPGEFLIFRVPAVTAPTPTPTSTPAPTPVPFNAGKAKHYKSDMVRAFAECSSPITATVDGVLSCAPPVPLSSYSYLPCKGNCQVKIDQKTETPCKTPPGASCCNCKIAVSCSGILDPTGNPINGSFGSGWSLATVWRETTNSTVPMTVIDFPYSIALTGVNGSIKLNTTCNTIRNSIPLSLSPMAINSSVEVVDIAIVDPDGNRFAVPGFNCCSH